MSEHFGIERLDPPRTTDERATLLGFLDYQRDTLLLKFAGLNGEQRARTHPPSTMTLAGMLKHLALVEHWWLDCVFLGQEYDEPWASVDWRHDPDWEWRTGPDDSEEALVATFDHARRRSDEVVAGAATLDALSQRGGRDRHPFSLRWILCHLIEEYARHNGHADLIRESIDGEVGE